MADAVCSCTHKHDNKGAVDKRSCYRLFRNIEDIQKLSELGVLFLLFEMGLELSLDRLKVSQSSTSKQASVSAFQACCLFRAFTRSGFPRPLVTTYPTLFAYPCPASMPWSILKP